MLGKSSRWKKENRLHNSVLISENNVTSDIRDSSIIHVSNFNKKVLKNALKSDILIFHRHRDTLIVSPTLLYELEKRVFLCTRLASSKSDKESSQIVITNFETSVRNIVSNTFKTNSTTFSTLSILALSEDLKNTPTINKPTSMTHFVNLAHVKTINRVSRYCRHYHHVLHVIAYVIAYTRNHFDNHNVSQSINSLISMFHVLIRARRSDDIEHHLPSRRSREMGQKRETRKDDADRRESGQHANRRESNERHRRDKKRTEKKVETRSETITKRRIETRIEEGSHMKRHLNSCRRSIETSICLYNLICCLLTRLFMYCVHNVSVSVAKAWSCLTRPSIIISTHCRTIYHPNLWFLSLSFTPLEPKLKPAMASFGTAILPERVSKTIYFISNAKSNHQFENKKTLETDKCFVLFKNRICLASVILANLMNNGIKLNERKRDDAVIDDSWSFLLILLSGDVEKNPGPLEVTLITLNCRGLKKEQKFKQLLSRVSSNNHSNVIVALQETHIETNNLNYIWKGKHIFTERNGSKGGIITLLSDNIIVKEQSDIGTEAQISLIEIIEQRDKHEIVLVNLHSPCAHNQDKIEFYNEIKIEIDKLLTKYDEAKVIIMGDYNTTFDDSERIGNCRSKSEKNVAKKIASAMGNLHLRDCWEGCTNSTMTWRHGNKMSRLDRIQWSNDLDCKLLKLESDWTYTQSDHSAVIAKLGEVKKRNRDKIVRIDTFFMNNVLLKHKFITELNLKMGQLSETNMNPHQKLEYLKMSIRSTAIEISSNFKKERDKEIENLRRDIMFWQSSFENAVDEPFKEFAVLKLDEAICKRDKLLDDIGEFICNRLKTKWYQEGEKGTKYFLNMQKSKGNKTELRSLLIDNQETDDPTEIDKLVEDFYKALYEKGNSKQSNVGLLPNFLTNLKKTDPLNIMSINAPLTITDLKNTLDSCTDSSPGPDGIPYSIIKLTWSHFGPLLIDSWNHANITGFLTHSHEESYLKLLPKDGKDLRLLKNWRPITLSNCDFKIITKTLACKLSKNLNNVISQNQTAYMRDRQITDNLHIIQYVTEQSDMLNNKSMIVSLDAEKVFDSVEHWYIRQILINIGLESFVKIFDLIYRNQTVTIHMNNREAGKYKIKNGVKQGDALSCILFILAIEPLISNINQDDTIKQLSLNGNDIPKTLAYADDVACIIYPDNNNLQKVFDHYQTMSDLSGLKLNADKTEIIVCDDLNSRYEIEYNQTKISLTKCDFMKINGLFIGYKTDETRTKNFTKIIDSMEKQLRLWSGRNLSIMGKIQIYKTFGLSQILYICGTVLLSKSEESQLNNLIYKFIWNQNMDSNRAPDRIKRTILKSKVTNLGFGMVDYQEVVMSIRVKNVLRLLSNPDQPLGRIIQNSINSSVIKINCLKSIRPTIDLAIKRIREIWSSTIKDCLREGQTSNDLANIVLNEYVGNLVYPRFKNKRLTLKHRHDHLQELFVDNNHHPVFKKLDKDIVMFLNLIPPDYVPNMSHDIPSILPIKNKFKNYTNVTSREIRCALLKDIPKQCKMILNPEETVLSKLGYLISKLTNVRLKTTLLRAI